MKRRYSLLRRAFFAGLAAFIRFFLLALFFSCLIFLDLLFYHRGLTCLVAFDLKVEPFEPADLGQLQFYLEALDLDVRKPH